MPAPASDADQAMLALFERLALEAGREVMRIFAVGCSVEHKQDASPVTIADRRSEAIILAGLREAYPDIPCVAEEEAAQGIVPEALGQTFFLIDPLDGTKEFVKRRTDFTVNIALVRNGSPEIGLVFAPCRSRCYAGRPGFAEVIETDADSVAVSRRRIAARISSQAPTIVASRSHSTPETEAYVRSIGSAEIVSVGSSLKFCLLASAEADIYPRFGRTMEWDTAAGDAVLRAAGGMTRTLDGQPLVYGKRNQADDEDFANPTFIAKGRPGKTDSDR